MRRALVTLPDGAWKVIDKELKGKIGDGDSEVIRNLVISLLTEKGYLLPSKQKSGSQIDPQIDQIAGELDMHDAMVEALVELLEEKGQIKYSDWENRIKKKVKQKS